MSGSLASERIARSCTFCTVSRGTRSLRVTTPVTRPRSFRLSALSTHAGVLKTTVRMRPPSNASENVSSASIMAVAIAATPPPSEWPVKSSFHPAAMMALSAKSIPYSSMMYAAACAMPWWTSCSPPTKIEEELSTRLLVVRFTSMNASVWSELVRKMS